MDTLTSEVKKNGHTVNLPMETVFKETAESLSIKSQYGHGYIDILFKENYIEVISKHYKNGILDAKFSYVFEKYTPVTISINLLGANIDFKKSTYLNINGVESCFAKSFNIHLKPYEPEDFSTADPIFYTVKKNKQKKRNNIKKYSKKPMLENIFESLTSDISMEEAFSAMA